MTSRIGPLFIPTASALMRITNGLYWSAGILLAFSAVLIVGAMGWTTTPDDLARAAFIAAALGLPAIVLFLSAQWLDQRADQQMESRSAQRQVPVI